MGEDGAFDQAAVEFARDRHRDDADELFGPRREDLPADDEQEFEHHMEDCRPCDAFFRTYKKSSELARETLRVEEIPEELQNRVRNNLKAKLGLER